MKMIKIMSVAESRQAFQEYLGAWRRRDYREALRINEKRYGSKLNECHVLQQARELWRKRGDVERENRVKKEIVRCLEKLMGLGEHNKIIGELLIREQEVRR